MLIVKILIGLAGLGLVVFVHELGHFIAARLAGIDVEAFSIGWGKPVLARKIGGVEYRLGMFPIGGYCKMRGENGFEDAWKAGQAEVAPAPGTFFAAPPAARILVAFAGPLFNLLLAMLIFTAIWGAGFEFAAADNRVVLASDLLPGESYPAERAGLKTGDRIVEINGKPVGNYNDIQRTVTVNAESPLRFKVLRDGSELDLRIEPALDKSSGAGRIGVYAWVEPVVESVLPGSAAAEAGLRAGDRVLSVNGEAFPYSAALIRILDGEAERPASLDIEAERDGAVFNTRIAASDDAALGIAWQTERQRTPRYSVFGAVGRGFAEMWETLGVSVRSLALLFRGIDLTQAVSGPVRITYMAGEIAANGFAESAGLGLRATGNFLALISVALAVMNLLPLPVLDGGLILIFLLEAVRRRPLHPRFISAFQTAGIVLIGALMLFAVFGDIVFLVKG